MTSVLLTELRLTMPATAAAVYFVPDAALTYTPSAVPSMVSSSSIIFAIAEFDFTMTLQVFISASAFAWLLDEKGDDEFSRDVFETYIIAVAEYTGTLGLSNIQYVKIKQSRNARMSIHMRRKSRSTIDLISIVSFIICYFPSFGVT